MRDNRDVDDGGDYNEDDDDDDKDNDGVMSNE